MAFPNVASSTFYYVLLLKKKEEANSTFSENTLFEIITLGLGI